jgi:hypothetical protein
MENTSIGTLLNELKALKIQESKIKARETQIISEIEALNRESKGIETIDKKRSTTDGEAKVSVNGISQGDRVVIKNKVTKPATCVDKNWTKERERIATVTRVSKDQIHFVTDNGTRTWRAPNNLVRLQEKEQDIDDECHR